MNSTKKLYAEITTINGSKHATNLSELPDPPTSIATAEKLLINLRWIKIEDDQVLNMDHVLIFRVKEL